MQESVCETVMPVIGEDGKLLGVTVKGVTIVRPQNIAWDDFAVSILNRIVTLPRDTESSIAKLLIAEDMVRIKKFKEAGS